MPAAEIARRLADEAARAGLPADSTPPDRTVQDWIRSGRIKQTEAQGPWRYTDGSPEAARLVLEWQRDFADGLGMPAYSVARAVGAEIARILEVAPGIRELKEYAYVVLLLGRAAATDEGRAEADTFLRCMPWRDGGSALAHAWLDRYDRLDKYGFEDAYHEAKAESQRDDDER
jgi:hypothetical protein